MTATLSIDSLVKFKKGDRVQFVTALGDATIIGTIKSINKLGLAKVVQDGGKYEWKIGAAKLQSGPALLKDEPSPMDVWTVTGYRCIGGDETPMYTAKIRFDGKIVAEASNGGRGGPDEFHFFQPADDAPVMHARFNSDVKAWWVQMGGEDTSEVEALWVDWYVNHKPVGITAKAYIKDFNDIVKEHESERE